MIEACGSLQVLTKTFTWEASAGYSHNYLNASGDTFNAIRTGDAGDGTSVDTTGNLDAVMISHSSTNKWQECRRVSTEFDLTTDSDIGPIPPAWGDPTITTAVLRIASQITYQAFGDTAFTICPGTSDQTISGYANYPNNTWGSIFLSTLDPVGYHDVTLNATARAYLQGRVDAVAAAYIGMRDYHDLNASEPTWQASQNTGAIVIGDGDVTYPPKLILTMTFTGIPF